MNKYLKKILKNFIKIKPLYLLVFFLISLVICLSALRANNEHMVTLRNDVYKADQQNKDVTLALQNLQSYVTTHMNTNLSDGNGSVYPPIQLKYTYQRLMNTESDQASATNLNLYTEAQTYCQSVDPNDFSGHNRVPCIEQYVENHDTSLAPIPSSLYEFDFVSPNWSPDLAGWSLVASILLFISLIFRLLLALYIRNKTKKK